MIIDVDMITELAKANAWDVVQAYIKELIDVSVKDFIRGDAAIAAAHFQGYLSSLKMVEEFSEEVLQEKLLALGQVALVCASEILSEVGPCESEETEEDYASVSEEDSEEGVEDGETDS
jgi:hypothetical protein